MKNPRRASEIGAKVSTAAVHKKPETALFNIPDVIKIYHDGKKLYFRRTVELFRYIKVYYKAKTLFLHWNQLQLSKRHEKKNK